MTNPIHDGATRTPTGDLLLDLPRAAHVAAKAQRQKLLLIWTITNHPRDYARWCVARPFAIRPGGSRPLRMVLLTLDLTAMHDMMDRLGLFCMPRHAEDDPVISETWM